MSSLTAQENPAQTHCRIDITGMDCGDCAKTIEASLAALPGVHSVQVYFARGSADVVYSANDVDRSALEGRIKALGYGISEPATTSWIFDIAGMDCGDCAKTVEAGVQRLPGVLEATVNFAGATLKVTPANVKLTPSAVIAAVAQAGYSASTQSATAQATHIWWKTRRVLETALASLLWLVGFGLEQTGAPRTASAGLFLAAMVIAGYPVARAGWFALRARRADMNLLMATAAIGAVAIGEWDEGSSVLILFAIGLTLQNLSLERTRRAIKALVALTPSEATLLRDGREIVVPVTEVAIGEIVLIRPGVRVPVDGIVISGHSSVDQSAITGESIPVDVEPDSALFAGSVNADGVLRVRSTKRASDTTLAHIVHMVEEAQASRAPAQAFVDRFAAIYTPIVVLGALLLATAVPFATNGDYRDWIFKALVLLVVACPCALVISTPVALVAAIGSASRRGVLFKGGAAIESLAGVRAIAFDKTGTLTSGKPIVAHIESLGTLNADEILLRAAAIEAHASHPLALGINRAAQENGLDIPPVTSEKNFPGRGMQADIDGTTYLVGSRRLFPDRSDAVEHKLSALEQNGMTAVLVGTTACIDGIVALADPIRPESANAAVRSLTALGLHTVMLTGDNRVTAERIGREAGVADIRAELLPEDKVAAIEELQRRFPTAMIGDGINDAPALATAPVGIAMGAGGADVAIEAADVVLMGDDLSQLPFAVRLSRRAISTIRQNIAASILVKAAFLALTFAGVTNLWLAVLADMGMSLLVTFNSLRLVSLRGNAHDGQAN